MYLLRKAKQGAGDFCESILNTDELNQRFKIKPGEGNLYSLPFLLNAL